MRMRRILTVLAAACLLVGLMATTSAAKGNNDVNRWEVLVLVNPETEVYYDWGFTLYEELTTLDGEHLGWSQGPCFIVDPDVGEEFVCDFGMRFPDGDITVNGAISFGEFLEGETVVPVTGGTGAFRNISGEVAIVPQGDFSYSKLVFDVKKGKASY
jgi:hypothetical protein